MNKMCGSIRGAQQQVSGTITIELPHPIEEIDDDTALRDQNLMMDY
jgi:hypothetical protein